MSQPRPPSINDSAAATSPSGRDDPILSAMSEPDAQSTLYRLIEAGQLARRALLAPLRENALEPGDDAVVFLLHRRGGATGAELAELLDLDEVAIEAHVFRLVGRGFVERRAVDPEARPGLALTGDGKTFHDTLATCWSQLEETLEGTLKKKHRKRLRHTLGDFVEALRG